MNLVKNKAHVVKHINRSTGLAFWIRIIALLLGTAAIIFSWNIFASAKNEVWQNVLYFLMAALLIVWSLFDLLNRKKIECDTHKQTISYQAFLIGKTELKFDELYKIYLWHSLPADQNVSAKDALDREAVEKLKLVDRYGEFISIKGTNKFNNVVRNFLNHVPLEIADE